MKPQHLLIGLLLSGSALAQQPNTPSPEMFGQLFMTQFDTDGNGQVSLDEFLAPSRRQFEAMDSNRDGVVSGAEVQAFSAMMQKMMQQRTQPPGR